MRDPGPSASPATHPAGNGEGSLAGLTFSLVGAGKVGRSLASWATARGARLAAVGLHRHRQPAEDLVKTLAAHAAGSGPGGNAGGKTTDLVPVEELSSVGQDLLLVAVADPALDEVVEVLSRHRQAAVVLHVAGSRGASALAPLGEGEAGGSAIGTLHPLKAFPHGLPDPAEARGVMFAIDGDPAAMALAERLALAWEGVPRHVPEADRDLYHLGATLAAGGVVTLLAAAERVAKLAGLPPEVLEGYLALAGGALTAAGAELAATGSFATAITGPAARGDGATVGRQLATLRALSPELAELAAGVARQALAALDEAGVEESAGRRELRQLLDGLGNEPGPAC